MLNVVMSSSPHGFVQRRVDCHPRINPRNNERSMPQREPRSAANSVTPAKQFPRCTLGDESGTHNDRLAAAIAAFS
jgi:hypothetical protein